MNDMTKPQGFTERLARAAVELSEPAGETLTMTRHCVLDWFATTIAGMNEPLAVILREAYAAGGDCSVPGGSKCASMENAALISGAISHALDFDDVHNQVGHPAAPIVAAALAAGEASAANGAQLLKAIYTGYEVAISVGSLAMPTHYDLGFHSTGTLGCIGAAAAAGSILNLDETRMATAISLAATQAAGLKAMFGSMAKPFHAGKAAANGIMAANLAARGLTAGPAAIEGKTGFLATQSKVSNLPQLVPPPMGDGILRTRFKKHASCYMTHSTIEALRSLKSDPELRSQKVAGIDIHVTPGHLTVCCIPTPRRGLEVKFSLAHIAAMVVDGRDTTSIASFSDEIANDLELLALRNKVRIHTDGPTDGSARVILHTTDGETLVAEANIDTPEPSLSVQEARLVAKFEALAVPVIGKEAAEPLRSILLTLGTGTKVGSLMAPLCR